MSLALLSLLALAPSEVVKPVIQPRLAETLAVASPSEPVRALVVMEDRPATRDLQRATSRLARRDRPAAVRAALEPWARASQAELIAVIQELEDAGAVSSHRLLWTVNAHRVTATPAALEHLATLTGVKTIRWDPELPQSELADVPPPPAAGGTPATLPYVTSFESGAIDAAFDVDLIGTGQAVVTTAHGPSGGTQHLVLDSSTAASSAAATATLHLDLRGLPGAILTFDLADFGTTDDPATGVWISSQGKPPVKVVDPVPGSGYQTYALNMKELSTQHSMAFTDDFEVLFSWIGLNSAPTDGLAVDEISAIVFTPLPPPTPNITALQAPLLWDIGIEGQGSLIMNVDSGTANDHPALTNQIWENTGEIPNNGLDDDNNGYVDDTWGWDFQSNDNNPYDTGHGTETAGIVMGNGANNGGERTGMAPLTTMAVGKISGESAALEAYQYAVIIGADCITSSYSFKWPSQPDYELFRISSEVELAAGIVHANSLGNQGDSTFSYPIPYNIATPGNCPGPWRHPQQLDAGLGSVLGCAGIFLPDDALYTASGQGPSTWENIDLTSPGYPNPLSPIYWDYPYAGGTRPGLLKPDMATYTNVKTTIGNNSYINSFGGTSAATPHLGGALCLMVNANESVPPRHISQALQTTAFDLGNPGKDLRFGAGKLQVYDAAKRILAAPTAYPHLPLVGELVNLEITGPAGSPFLLLFSLTQDTLPTTLGIQVGLGLPLSVLLTGQHTGVTTPTILPLPIPNNQLLSGLEFHLQVITDDSAGTTGEWLASVVETVEIQ